MKSKIANVKRRRCAEFVSENVEVGIGTDT